MTQKYIIDCKGYNITLSKLSQNSDSFYILIHVIHNQTLKEYSTKIYENPTINNMDKLFLFFERCLTFYNKYEVNFEIGEKNLIIHFFTEFDEILNMNISFSLNEIINDDQDEIMIKYKKLLIENQKNCKKIEKLENEIQQMKQNKSDYIRQNMNFENLSKNKKGI